VSATVQPRSIHSPVQRDTATFLETTQESRGRRTLLEIELAPGGGTIAHRHMGHAERFVALDGELTVRVDGLLHVLRPGDEATAAAGALHHFANETGEAIRFQVELAPGHRGFEQALQIGYGLAGDGLTDDRGIPRKLSHAALLMQMGDMRVAGPLRVLAPLLGLLARRARRRGADAVLVERYVRY
jgi:quercetin dioxygenase-like cupin family protein